MIAVVAATPTEARRLSEDLRDEEQVVLDIVHPAALASLEQDALARLDGADTLILAAAGVLTPDLVAACDRRGLRVVLLTDREADLRAARAFGLPDPLPPDAPAWRIVEAASGPGTGVGETMKREGRILVVWGPEGAPGRTTVAIELALAHARAGRHVALVDADTRAPSVAIIVGLADESPGFAAACRQAESGLLDAGELLRVSVPLGDADGRVDVLTGINRVSRWPELSAARVTAALEVIRTWADVVVVDISGSLETDEEIVSDLDGPRRHAATLASLGVADQIVAVGSPDPVGLSRLVRGHAELRAIVGTTPVRVVINRIRSGPLGVDPRGQVRRALERFSGVTEVSFIPDDRRASDAALLSARPVGEVAPRSGLAQAVRRLADELDPDGARARRPAPEPPGTRAEARDARATRAGMRHGRAPRRA